MKRPVNFRFPLFHIVLLNKILRGEYNKPVYFRDRTEIVLRALEYYAAHYLEMDMSKVWDEVREMELVKVKR